MWQHCTACLIVIINDDQQDATILDLFLSSLLYMFRAIPSPSSGAHNCTYSFGYCQPVLLLAGIMDEMEMQFHLIHDTSQQQYWLTTIPEAVSTVMCP
jgi:hypothetical protein